MKVLVILTFVFICYLVMFVFIVIPNIALNSSWYKSITEDMRKDLEKVGEMMYPDNPEEVEEYVRENMKVFHEEEGPLLKIIDWLVSNYENNIEGIS